METFSGILLIYQALFVELQVFVMSSLNRLLLEYMLVFVCFYRLLHTTAHPTNGSSSLNRSPCSTILILFSHKRFVVAMLICVLFMPRRIFKSLETSYYKCPLYKNEIYWYFVGETYQQFCCRTREGVFLCYRR